MRFCVSPRGSVAAPPASQATGLSMMRRKRHEISSRGTWLGSPALDGGGVIERVVTVGADRSGGVRIIPNDHHMRRRHHRWDRGHRERCRTVVEHRRNRFGERVTRRTRVCPD